MNSKKTIIIIGQLPPTITGQSLVTSEVYNILQKSGGVIRSHNLFYSEFRHFKKYIILFKTVFNLTSDIIKYNSVIYLSAARTKPGFYRNAYIILLSNLFKRKIIIHFHCGEYNNFLINNGSLFLKFAKYLFKMVDVSIILGNSLIKNYDIIFNNKMKIIVIPNGISIKQSKIAITDHSFFNILYMSNLIESKGYFDLLEAVNILVNEYKIYNIRVDLCGKFMDHEDNISFKTINEYILNFKNYISRNNLSSFIKYQDVVNGEIKDLLYENCDIFILPTYYSKEAQPLSILEALSYGKIVITTNHRGIPDMVINDYNGLIVESKSPRSIVNAILKIINNQSLQNKLSINAIDHVVNNFSLDNFEKNIINLFKKYNAI